MPVIVIAAFENITDEIPDDGLSFILHDNAIDVMLRLYLVLRHPGLIAIDKWPEPDPEAGFIIDFVLLDENSRDI